MNANFIENNLFWMKFYLQNFISKKCVIISLEQIYFYVCCSSAFYSEDLPEPVNNFMNETALALIALCEADCPIIRIFSNVFVDFKSYWRWSKCAKHNWPKSQIINISGAKNVSWFIILTEQKCHWIKHQLNKTSTE